MVKAYAGPHVGPVVQVAGGGTVAAVLLQGSPKCGGPVVELSNTVTSTATVSHSGQQLCSLKLTFSKMLSVAIRQIHRKIAMYSSSSMASFRLWSQERTTSSP
jgi:hypothetical protein